MSDLGHQSGSNGENPEVNSRHEISLDKISVYIRRMRESNLLMFSDDIDFMSAEQ